MLEEKERSHAEAQLTNAVLRSFFSLPFSVLNSPGPSKKPWFITGGVHCIFLSMSALLAFV